LAIPADSFNPQPKASAHHRWSACACASLRLRVKRAEVAAEKTFPARNTKSLPTGAQLD
jgi:hypothetical protein